MRSPSNASFRVAARARRMTLRVSQPASRRTSLRSRSKQSACTCCRATRDSTPAHTGAQVSRVGDDLASLLAANVPRCLRSTT